MSKADTKDFFFVFFKPLSENWNDIKKPSLPKNWYWVGSGQWDEKGYPREYQYSGPAKTYKGARLAVEGFFKRLKKSGKVQRFKIRKRIPRSKPRSAMSCVLL